MKKSHWVVLIAFLIVSCSVNDRLFNAAQKGDLGKVKEMVNNGADINYIENGSTPLYEASKVGRYEVARFLIEKGAHVNSKYKGGRTVLMEAVAFNHPKIVTLLINNKADLNAESDLSHTALSIAITLKRDDMILELRKAGAKEKISKPVETEKISQEEALKRADESYKKYMETRKKY